jgi:hypothetical protein
MIAVCRTDFLARQLLSLCDALSSSVSSMLQQTTPSPATLSARFFEPSHIKLGAMILPTNKMVLFILKCLLYLIFTSILIIRLIKKIKVIKKLNI